MGVVALPKTPLAEQSRSPPIIAGQPVSLKCCSNWGTSEASSGVARRIEELFRERLNISEQIGNLYRRTKEQYKWL